MTMLEKEWCGGDVKLLSRELVKSWLLSIYFVDIVTINGAELRRSQWVAWYWFGDKRRTRSWRVHTKSHQYGGRADAEH